MKQLLCLYLITAFSITAAHAQELKGKWTLEKHTFIDTDSNIIDEGQWGFTFNKNGSFRANNHSKIKPCELKGNWEIGSDTLFIRTKSGCQWQYCYVSFLARTVKFYSGRHCENKPCREYFLTILEK
jgi:hypothetical protein